MESFKNSNFKILFQFEKNGTRNPSPPFITSSLQQEASSSLGYNVKRTMSIAQKLYEKGLITYMRTDSINLSKDAINGCEKYIKEKFGEEYYQLRKFNKKSKNAQEAHEAIRPTNISKDNINYTEEENKLYNLIWRQTVASMMSSAKIKTIYLQISIDNQEKYYFESTIEEIVFLGYLKIYGKEIEEAGNIPKKNDILNYDKITANQEFTKSIGRYNEASLVKTLLKNGIGRPSTFAGILSKIQDKEYVLIKNIEGEKKVINLTLKNNEIDEMKKEINIGSEKKKFVPTDIGYRVINYLNDNFDNIMDFKFTALMENKLDEIASDQLNWINMLNEFYEPFNKKVESLFNNKIIVEDKLLGEIDNNKVYISRTKYGDVLKMVINGSKPKYVSIEEKDKDEITLEDAIQMFKYPLTLGIYKNDDVVLNKGKYGFYIKYKEKIILVINN